MRLISQVQIIASPMAGNHAANGDMPRLEVNRAVRDVDSVNPAMPAIAKPRYWRARLPRRRVDAAAFCGAGNGNGDGSSPDGKFAGSRAPVCVRQGPEGPSCPEGPDQPRACDSSPNNVLTRKDCSPVPAAIPPHRCQRPMGICDSSASMSVQNRR